jgi:hypothetical protein
MRKLTRLLGASLGLLWVLSFGPPVAEAGPTCTASCSSGATLQCCLTSGYCTASSGSIDCNGTLMTCGPIDAYNACEDDCVAQKNYCAFYTCQSNKVCYGDYCYPEYRDCLASCGPRPTTNIGC